MNLSILEFFNRPDLLLEPISLKPIINQTSMRIIEKIEVIKRASSLIDKETTGPAGQFAKRIGTSRTCVFQLLEEIKELGVPIKYDHRKKSYCYTGGKKLVVSNPIEVVIEEQH